LRTGRDISIICHDDGLSYLDNDGLNAPQGPAFTATRSSIRAAGRRCAEILLSLIETPDQPYVQELWEPDLTLGRSTGPAPRS
jgi:LacI family transcriptional regulator